MRIDDLHRNKYLIVNDDGSIGRGWSNGIRLTEQKGSPVIDLVPTETIDKIDRINTSTKLQLDGLWPDTTDYEQNSPNIIERARDLDDRWFASDIEKALYLNVLRVPVCASYLAVCAKVQPHTILELGTGGDSAHSTGIFLYWLGHLPGYLVSVDRHYLSHTWLRYRDYPTWCFIQGDSISVMKAIINKKINHLPLYWFDMIFIDSSHNYPHTKMELIQASRMTDAILMDDTHVPEVARSRDEFLAENPDWLTFNVAFDLVNGVSLLERHERLSKT